MSNLMKFDNSGRIMHDFFYSCLVYLFAEKHRQILAPLATPETFSIGVMRLANAKRTLETGFVIGHLWSSISWLHVYLKTRDGLESVKRIGLGSKRIGVRLLGSAPCANWLAFVLLLNKDEGPPCHVLRRSALFKPNHYIWSYSFQLYFEIIRFIYIFCNGKVNWKIICHFIRNLDRGKNLYI